jgi:hypothetical protein
VDELELSATRARQANPEIEGTSRRRAEVRCDQNVLEWVHVLVAVEVKPNVGEGAGTNWTAFRRVAESKHESSSAPATG